MAHTGIFATKAEIDVKVGENVNSTGYTETNINNACAQSESFINVKCRTNFSDSYSGLNADVKRILSEISACWVAIDFIAYNMAGYTSRVEAEDMINLHWAKIEKLLEVLEESKNQTWMASA